MRYTFDPGALKAAVDVAGRATAGRSTIEALAYLHLDGHTLTGSDAEVTVAVTVAADLEDPAGPVLLPADPLARMLREAPQDAPIDLTVDGDGKITLTAGGAEYQMATVDARTYPAVADVPDDAPGYVLPAGTLADGLARVAYAASQEEGKYAMCGVLFDPRPAGLALVATDGKQLAVIEVAADVTGNPSIPDGVHEAPFSVLVPTAAAKHLVALLKRGDPESAVEVRLTRSLIEFRSRAGVLTARLLEGRFPPYRDVIPKTFLGTLGADAADLTGAVRRAQIMTDDDAAGVVFDLAPGRLTLSAQSRSKGKSVVTTEADYIGKLVAVRLDPKFVLGALHAAGDDVLMRVGDRSGKPGSVVFVAGSWQALVVPME